MEVTDAIVTQIDTDASPDLGAHHGFQEAVLTVAARAKAALPDAADRIDTAAALVLAGAVELREGGRTARVVSQTDGTTAYHVNGQCQCPDFATAPGHFCAHRLAYGIAKRATGLAQERLEPLPAPAGQDTGAPPGATDSAVGIATGGDCREPGHHPGPSEAAPLADVLAIPAQYLQLIEGKPFVKYAGLLALAHDRGLQQLEARFTRVSDTLAVAHATATFADGRRFTESGDATPENVGSQVRPHFARLALTRAKARCLRDALNIGLCAVEELGG
jgi:hypothetical protein